MKKIWLHNNKGSWRKSIGFKKKLHGESAKCRRVLTRKPSSKSYNEKISNPQQFLCISNLDHQTKEIYRKNIQICDALELHTEDAERLKKVCPYNDLLVLCIF